MKKGQMRNTLIALVFLLATLIILIANASYKSTFESRPIGTAQTAILEVGKEAEKADMYLQQSAKIASQEAALVFKSKGGVLEDHEGEEFPCGEFIGYPLWNNEDLCIPDFEENFIQLFQAQLVTSLVAHPLYVYPLSFTYTVDDRTIEGISLSPLILDFVGGGRDGFGLADAELFTPDYSSAKVTTRLISGSRGGKSIEYVVLHYTVTRDVDAAVQALASKGFSYHYIVDNNGDVYQFVPEEDSAQHAGCSKECSEFTTCEETCFLPGMNQISIGISLVNCGFDTDCQTPPVECEEGFEECWEPFPEEQVVSLTSLLADIGARNDLTIEDAILSHSDVTEHKQDPGPALKLPEIIEDIGTNYESTSPTGAVVQHLTGNVVSVSGDALARLNQYEDIITLYADENNLDPAIIKSLIYHESRAVADASNSWNALGLMQIVPFRPTGAKVNHDFCVERCGFTPADTLDELNREEYFNPNKNICCGAAFFAEKAKNNPKDWNCCAEDYGQEICINTRYTTPYEIAARYYNGWGCGGAVDPDYVETIMELYNYFGGNPLQFAGTDAGVFVGKYEIPLVFEVATDVDLESFTALSEFAQGAIDTCYDMPKTCLEELLVDGVGMSCGNPFINEFIAKYLSCPDGVCGITLEPHEHDDFTMLLFEDEVWDVVLEEPIYVHHEPLVDAPLSFRFTYEEEWFVEVIRDDEPFIEKKPLAESVFFVEDEFINEAEVFKEPVQKKFLLCGDLNFSLELDDRIPPPITELFGMYDNETETYYVQWEPVMHYEDGKEVLDLESYIVYCSVDSFEYEDVTPEKVILTIMHSSSLFPLDTTAITVPIEDCAGSVLTNGIYIGVVPADHVGQFHESVASIYLTEDSMWELPHPVVHNDELLTLK